MRWLPWKRRNGGEGRHRRGEDVDVTHSQDLTLAARQAEMAKARADKVLEDTLKRAPEVHEVASAIERRLERNHWAEMMEYTFQRKQHG